MAFIALSFVAMFLSYYILCNLSYDVTGCRWHCNNQAYLWIDFTIFSRLSNKLHYLPNVSVSWLKNLCYTIKQNII